MNRESLSFLSFTLTFSFKFQQILTLDTHSHEVFSQIVLGYSPNLAQIATRLDPAHPNEHRYRTLSEQQIIELVVMRFAIGI